MCSKNVTKVEQFCYKFDHAVYEKMHSYCCGNRSLFVDMVDSMFNTEPTSPKADFISDKLLI